MTQANSALSRANSVLCTHHLPLRQRAGHNTRWVSIYENLPGRRVRERSVRGCSSQDDQLIEELCFQLVSEARKQPDASLEQLLSARSSRKVTEKHERRASPLAGRRSVRRWWLQRRQGVNMNLVGPFKGQAYFRLLPADRAAREADVRRFALHTGESLLVHLSEPFKPLVPVATHRQGFRQKREVVSLLRCAGFGAIATESLSDELKGMVNRKKLALVAAGESRRRIPSTAAIQE